MTHPSGAYDLEDLTFTSYFERGGIIELKCKTIARNTKVASWKPYTFNTCLYGRFLDNECPIIKYIKYKSLPVETVQYMQLL